MRLEDLYAKQDEILRNVLNISVLDHFIFDLTDDNSQTSLKGAFKGIESLLMPECGKYLVVTTMVENPDCLILMFPQDSDDNVEMKVFNTKSGKYNDLTDGQGRHSNDGTPLTIDNFTDFANMEDITRRFNEFVFNAANGEDSANEVKDIGSFDVSNDEPVEINNTITTDNEETKMNEKFKPITEEIEDTNEPKWVEIPNSNAHQVTVEDGEEGQDPFAGEMPAADAAAPEGGDAAAAPAEGDGATAPAEGDGAAAPTEGGEEAPTEGGDAGAVDDPKAKMRELLAYYTNYMNELVQDPNTSTELISATQEMIDSLIKNMESADGIEEVKADAEEDAKDEVSAEPAEGGEEAAAPAEGGEAAAPAEGGEEAPVTEDTEDDAKLDELKQDDVDAKIDSEIDDLHKDDVTDIAPITGDDITVPGDLRNSSVNDVDISTDMPTPDEELATTAPDMAAPAPTSDVDVLADTADMTPDEEVSLMGPDDDAMVGPDGLPLDKFEGDVDSLATAPCAKKIAWSPDYATNGVATSDDNTIVVPAVLNELNGYYGKVADEVSKVPGKEDISAKLQKIQILSQTIANEWNGILSELGGAVPSSFDRDNMCDLEKDELDSMDAMNMVGADIMADQEKEEEDDLAIDAQIDSFVESFKHLI